ncbi:hypothetical protein L345_06954, partial [Ophiophagus hannah]
MKESALKDGLVGEQIISNALKGTACEALLQAADSVGFDTNSEPGMGFRRQHLANRFAYLPQVHNTEISYCAVGLNGTELEGESCHLESHYDIHPHLVSETVKTVEAAGNILIHCCQEKEIQSQFEQQRQQNSKTYYSPFPSLMRMGTEFGEGRRDPGRRTVAAEERQR